MRCQIGLWFDLEIFVKNHNFLHRTSTQQLTIWGRYYHFQWLSELHILSCLSFIILYKHSIGVTYNNGLIKKWKCWYLLLIVHLSDVSDTANSYFTMNNLSWSCINNITFEITQVSSCYGIWFLLFGASVKLEEVLVRYTEWERFSQYMQPSRFHDYLSSSKHSFLRWILLEIAYYDFFLLFDLN